MTDSLCNRNRAALLVIHGVGQQDPYQMLDVFGRGLIDHYSVQLEKIEPRLFRLPHETRIRSGVRLHFKPPLEGNLIQELDVLEFYWAGMVQGRVTLWQMLRWAFKTSIPPLKLWSQQTTAGEGQKNLVQLLPTLLRELGTAFGLLLAIALVIFPFLYIIVNIEAFAQAGRELLAVLQTLSNSSPGLFGSLILFILAILEFFVVLSLLFILLRLSRPQAMEAKMIERWAVGSLGLFLVLLLLIVVVIDLSQWPTVLLLWEISRILLSAPVGWGILALLLAYFAGKFMVDFVGDIPLYVDADEKSEFHRTRDQIKQAGVELISNLLDEKSGYRAIYVAGHSLGSVIAYDCLNQLIRKVRADDSALPTRLRGLLTFGSPLDKIYYFFRDAVGDAADEQAIRAQIQSFLHGFRKKSSGRKYGRYKFAPYEIPKLEDLQWVNVYSVMDIVSDRLDFYEVNDQVHLRYFSPFTAHVSYWRDPNFYHILAKLLEYPLSTKQ